MVVVKENKLATNVQAYLSFKLSPLTEDSSVVRLLYPEQLENLQRILFRCVLQSESNSILIMGPRGAGKTFLMNTAIRELAKCDHAKGNYSIVNLMGTIHTDDRIALKDITRQLQLENVVGDRIFGSFSENLQFLLDSLKSGEDRSKAKSSIFILDDFELFTQHKNQTLLYNLFDVAQSRQAPIAVIGLCSRLDAVELLEKRVKSRFAHRFLYLMNSLKDEEYITVAETLLSINPDDFVDKAFAKRWNNDLKKVIIPQMRRSFLKLYDIDRIIRSLVNCLQPMIRQLDEDMLQLKPTVFRDTVNSIYENEPKLVVISRLPALHVVLLVCMLRLNAIYDGEPFNFELLFKEFSLFSRETKSLLNLPKHTVLKAFESICDLELAQPLGGNGVMSMQKRYRLYHSHFSGDLIRQAIEQNNALPTDVTQWISTTLNDRALRI